MESVIYGLLGDLFSLKIVMAGENLEKMQKNVFVCLHKNPSKATQSQHQAQEPARREVADALKLTQPRFVNRSTFSRLMPYFKKD